MIDLENLEDKAIDFDGERFKKLPKWARFLIQKLDADKRYWKMQAVEAHAKLLKEGIVTVDNQRVRFQVVTPGSRQVLQIHGDAKILIEPRANNMVWVWFAKG